MNYSFPNDVAQQVREFLATGQFADEDDVLRGALSALAQRTFDREESDLEAIRAGLEDVEAGRYRPIEEVDLEIRKKFNFQALE
jgi:Arc/MetJ-type ribon-helix-helix transcriptional regulator